MKLLKTFLIIITSLFIPIIPAVSYANTTNVDVVLIIDATGSMDSNDPQDIRKEAARVFIDTAQAGDQIAVISFDEDAYVLAALQPIFSQNDRDLLKTAVDQVGDSGGTNINAALISGFNALSRGLSNPKAAILLTDGEHTSGGDYDPHSHLPYIQQGWPIYTIGLGDDADAALLNWIAQDTRGQYIALTNPNQLQEIYFEISQIIGGGKTLLDTSLTMNQGESRQLNVDMPEERDSTTFFSNWEGSEVSMSLKSPNGQVIDPATTDSNVFHAKGLTYEIYSIQNPEKGDWRIGLYGTDIPENGENVNVKVAAQGLSESRYLPLVVGGSEQKVTALYFDDFSDPRSGWYTRQTSSTIWSYQENKYEILLSVDNRWAGSVAPDDMDLIQNYAVEVDANRQAGSTVRYGLIFNWKDWNNFYTFFITPDTQQYAIWRYDRDANPAWSFVTGDRVSTINSTGEANRLKVERIGTKIRFYIDGSLIESIPIFTGNYRLGVYVSNANGAAVPAAARFDNFRVSQLGQITNQNRSVSPPPIAEPGGEGHFAPMK